MWVVKKVGFITSKGETIYDFFLYLNETALKTTHFVVHLSNLETGDYVVLRSDYDSSIVKTLEEYKPYGFFDLVYERNAGVCYVLLIQIDDAFMQFMELVDKVSVQEVQHSYQEGQFKDKLTPCFESLDDALTLFYCDTNTHNGVCYCTLLDAMAYCKGNWDGADFVINAKKKASLEFGVADVLYRVSFKDVEAAKAFFSKRLLSGENPVRCFAEREFY